MPKTLSMKQASSLVNRYCKSMEVELSGDEKERIARYLQLQSKNRLNSQTTLVPEDAAVMEKLAKLIGEL
jgi:hypothetical protein